MLDRDLRKWGSCLSTVRAIGCGCWFTNAAIYTLCFQYYSSLSGDMRPEDMAPYSGAAVLRQLPHSTEFTMRHLCRLFKLTRPVERNPNFHQPNLTIVSSKTSRITFRLPDEPLNLIHFQPKTSFLLDRK